jgi:hypothetical protein
LQFRAIAALRRSLGIDLSGEPDGVLERTPSATSELGA